MTLIATYIGKYGIIHATDSNVTRVSRPTSGPSATTTAPGKKMFEAPHIAAGVTVAGSYAVGASDMPTWMNAFIQTRAALPADTLREFAEALRTELEQDMTPKQKRRGSIIHIAGYVSDGGTSHPEFWFVRNVHGIDRATGGYTDIRDDFAISEDFWSRDYPRDDSYEHGGYYQYANGFPEGRISFMGVHQCLLQFFTRSGDSQDGDFDPPLLYRTWRR